MNHQKFIIMFAVMLFVFSFLFISESVSAWDKKTTPLPYTKQTDDEVVNGDDAIYDELDEVIEEDEEEFNIETDEEEPDEDTDYDEIFDENDDSDDEVVE